ncbi:MAG: adenylate/guanylate cyclase domain-containing protein [Elainellaceae cyanobacterium]
MAATSFMNAPSEPLPPAPSSGTILIVDDVPDNIQVLARILESEGYRVRKAVSGQLAIQTAVLSPPDLVLLDISMPVMDGYMVCQQLKDNPETQAIPVIFLSALGETSSKIKAFELGGVDYITKPFHADEVLARVSTQIKLYKMQQQLHSQAQELQARNVELRKAEAKYRSIFENASEGIFQMTPDGHYSAANPAMARICGYDSAKEFMETITDIDHQFYVHPKRRYELAAYLRRYGEIANAESEIYRKDGSTVWINETIRAVKDSADELCFYEGTVQDITERRQIELEIRRQRFQSERLLINVLPQTIAQRLKAGTHTIADNSEHVSVLFADLVNFTKVSAYLSPKELVELLNQIFSTFDQLVDTYKLEKIKTIGDAYMVAAGVPLPRPDHLEAIAHFALDMQTTIQHFTQPDGKPFQLRIGINTGSVTAGVIGTSKFAYDLWGHTVNLASRMEETCLPGKIQVPVHLYEQLKNEFILEPRGVIDVQGLGEVETYFLKERASQR